MVFGSTGNLIPRIEIPRALIPRVEIECPQGHGGSTPPPSAKNGVDGVIEAFETVNLKAREHNPPTPFKNGKETDNSMLRIERVD